MQQFNNNTSLAGNLNNDFVPKSIAPKKIDPNADIKQWIWIYFLLWIFEGALRKWFLPFLASPLLIIRDPVALMILYLAIKRNLFISNSYVVGMGILGVVGIITALLLGHHNLGVALFGARIILLHFPLIFAIGRVFTYEDVVKMGRITVLIAIPMAVLVAMQFYSPQSAWVNRGVGGDTAGAGFSGANGFFRPPATFSFITGTVAFYTLSASFIIFFWLKKGIIKPIYLYAATFALMVVIPLSISRSLFFGVLLVLVFMAIAISRKTEYLGKMIFGGAVIVLLFSILSKTSFFSTGTDAFTSRFENANEAEGGVQGVLVDRFLGGMYSALMASGNQPFFGYGMGMGTNAGSFLMTGNTGFLIAEGEWGRVIGEMGAVMGIMLIMYRVSLSVSIAFASFKGLSKGNLLPWLLLSIVLVNLPQGQWAQPSSLGFCTLVTGLCIAALKGPTPVAKAKITKLTSTDEPQMV